MDRNEQAARQSRTLGLANASLAQVLDRHVATGELWRTEGDKIRCVACGHRCLVAEGRRGICRVRFNQGAQLKVPFGYVAGVASDPIEKKPFFHVYPGSDALTFGMLGCDFHCAYCQNWVSSQALRDSASEAPIRAATAEQLVNSALRSGARSIISSYNEPLITAEWAVAVFRKAKEEGLLCAFVSNGNATAEALDFLQPWIAAYKVDLKTFNDRNYRSLGGTLKHVTDTIRMVHERGLWTEIVTLLVPGFNDSDVELRAMAEFIVSVSRDIPWHITAFHQDYKMTDPRNTRAEDLWRAAEIGVQAGLNYVYAGNLPGRAGEWEHTFCPQCRERLIERCGFEVQSYRITAEGKCPKCSQVIPGIWIQDGEDSGGGNASGGLERGPRRVSL